jgi:hypothetical protein
MPRVSGRTIRVEIMDEAMAAVLRRKTGAARLQIASDLFSSARRMLLNHVRSTHPGWSEERVVQEVSQRLSGRAV